MKKIVSFFKIKLKNKGFTLIELLASIVLIGLLASVTTVSVVRYHNSSRLNAYVTLSQNTYEAAENCIINNSLSCKGTNGEVITVSTLKSLNYIDSLSNPLGKGEDCDGKVTILVSGSGEFKKYKYDVYLNCPGYTPNLNTTRKNTILWPDYREGYSY